MQLYFSSCEQFEGVGLIVRVHTGSGTFITATSRDTDGVWKCYDSACQWKLRYQPNLICEHIHFAKHWYETQYQHPDPATVELRRQRSTEQAKIARDREWAEIQKLRAALDERERKFFGTTTPSILIPTGRKIVLK